MATKKKKPGVRKASAGTEIRKHQREETEREQLIDKMLGPVLDPSLDPVQVRAAVETLRDVLDTYRESISQLDDDGEMPQELIAIAQFAQQGQSTLQDIYKIFEANALRLHDGKGKFSAGPFGVFFETQKGKRTVAWKEIALENRALLCEEQGKPFDASQYEALVKAKTVPSDDKTKVVIRENG